MKKIYFYNTFHNGDLHYSRTFVRDIMQKLGDNDYYYLHNNHPDVLKDLNIKHDKSFDSFLDWRLMSKYPINYFKQIIEHNDCTYINTWVGQQGWITSKGVNRNRDNRYCSLYSYYELFEDIFDKLNISIEGIEYYIPEIDFNYVKTEEIDNFVKGKTIILVANNKPETIRIQFDLNQVVDKMSDECRDITFVLTNNANIKKSNVFYISDIVNVRPDFNEISYLSKFSKISIGKPSGPYCFTHIKDNFMDPNKHFITLSENKYDMFYFDSPSEVILISNYTIENIENQIKTIINE